jgi:hypothetical protein
MAKEEPKLVGVRLPPKLARWLKAEAVRENTTQQALVEDALGLLRAHNMARRKAKRTKGGQDG